MPSLPKCIPEGVLEGGEGKSLCAHGKRHLNPSFLKEFSFLSITIQCFSKKKCTFARNIINNG